MRALALWGAVALATGQDPEDPEDVCLLQSGQFLQKSLEEDGPLLLLHVVAGANVMKHEDIGDECPGGPVELRAEAGKCSVTGLNVVTEDGTGITEFFGDNVQMKDFHFYVNGAKDAWINLKDFPFHVKDGGTQLVVEGRDLAGLTKRCHRTVHVIDSQPPKWKTVESVNTVPINLGDTCSKPTASLLIEYEKMGWDSSASDNCPGEPQITRQVRHKGKILYDDTREKNTDTIHGPGEYEVVYIARDANAQTLTHTATVTLVDKDGPTKIECRPTIDGEMEEVVLVEPDATEGIAKWFLPKVIADNCLKTYWDYGMLPKPVEANGHKSGDTFPVGVHTISYTLYDNSKNVAEKECSFNVKIEQKAHPVKITCPPSVTFNTVKYTEFGVPTWDAATATQGPKKLPHSAITYKHNVHAGLPFPYGTTHVTARAVGEKDKFDECVFSVTIADPQRPSVDGRHYRCGAAGDVEPWGVCSGTDLVVAKHEGYATTGGYDLRGTTKKKDLACCDDEHGTKYHCDGTDAGWHFKYCKPDKSWIPPDERQPSVETGGAGGGGDGKIGNPACPYPGGGVCLSTKLMLLDEATKTQLAVPAYKTFVAASCDACSGHCKFEKSCQWYAFCPKENPQCADTPNQCRLWDSCLPPKDIR
jgi:hypothetical protein